MRVVVSTCQQEMLVVALLVQLSCYVPGAATAHRTGTMNVARVTDSVSQDRSASRITDDVSDDVRDTRDDGLQRDVTELQSSSSLSASEIGCDEVTSHDDDVGNSRASATLASVEGQCCQGHTAG